MGQQCITSVCASFYISNICHNNKNTRKSVKIEDNNTLPEREEERGGRGREGGGSEKYSVNRAPALIGVDAPSFPVAMIIACSKNL